MRKIVLAISICLTVLGCNNASKSNQARAKRVASAIAKVMRDTLVNGKNLIPKIDFEHPPWETGCDSLTTQYDMNMCTGEKATIADSILNLYYNALIKYIDTDYAEEIKQAKDTTDEYEREYLQQLRDEKQAIIKSRTDF